jgi:aminopeptidase N
VRLEDGLDDAALLLLLGHDSDAFNRWEASQRLALRRMQSALASGGDPVLDEAYLHAMRGLLRHPALDAAFKCQALTLPSETDVAESSGGPVNPQRIHAVRESMRRQMAEHLHADWVWAYDAHQVHEGYRPDADQSGRRALANLALRMLVLHAVAR